MGFAKKIVFAWFGVLTMLVCACNPSWAAAGEDGTFLLTFESRITWKNDTGATLGSHVNSVFTLDPTEGLPGRNFKGSGRLK